MRTPSGHEVYAMGAEYPSPAALYEAAKMVRDAGFKRWDVHSPFPIHGMDEAMGLGKSWLSAVVLAGGISAFHRAGSARITRAQRRRAHHHRARGLIYVARLPFNFPFADDRGRGRARVPRRKNHQ